MPINDLAAIFLFFCFHIIIQGLFCTMMHSTMKNIRFYYFITLLHHKYVYFAIECDLFLIVTRWGAIHFFPVFFFFWFGVGCVWVGGRGVVCVWVGGGVCVCVGGRGGVESV